MASAKCGCFIADDGDHLKVEERWENQRRIGFPPRWRTDKFDFSDKSRSKNLYNFPLPKDWEWVKGWQIDLDSFPEGKGGWHYSPGWEDVFHAKFKKSDRVRRRRYFRTRRFCGPPGECFVDRISIVDAQGMRTGWLFKKSTG
eukprot:158431_1